jgi:hypothetical protein
LTAVSRQVEVSMSKLDDLVAASRRVAEEVLSRTKQREKAAEWLTLRDQRRQAEDAKTERLRELRLAKEAAQQPQQATIPVRGAPRKKPKR